jgi:hypothetical protein
LALSKDDKARLSKRHIEAIFNNQHEGVVQPFKLSTDLNILENVARLGRSFMKDDAYGPKNVDEGLFFLKLAANNGHPRAAFVLGDMFEFGKNVTQSYSEAACYYQLASNNGEPDAQEFADSCREMIQLERST